MSVSNARSSAVFLFCASMLTILPVSAKNSLKVQFTESDIVVMQKMADIKRGADLMKTALGIAVVDALLIGKPPKGIIDIVTSDVDELVTAMVDVDTLEACALRRPIEFHRVNEKSLSGDRGRFWSALHEKLDEACVSRRQTR